MQTSRSTGRMATVLPCLSKNRYNALSQFGPRRFDSPHQFVAQSDFARSTRYSRKNRTQKKQLLRKHSATGNACRNLAPVPRKSNAEVFYRSLEFTVRGTAF